MNEDYPFAATIPAGTTCSGTIAGQSNVCLVKIVNPSGAGPFGGVIAIQMSGAGAGAEASNSTAGAAATGAATTGSGTGTSTGSDTTAAKTEKAGHAGGVGNAVRPKLNGAKFRHV